MRDYDAVVIDREVGRRIKLRRLELKISQSALASALGVTFQQVQKYEQGTNRVSASRLFSISEALGVKPAFFFDTMPPIAGMEDAAKDADIAADWLRLQTAFWHIKAAEMRKALVVMAEALADRASE